MAPLQPPHNFKFRLFFFQINESDVTSFNNQPLNLIPFDLEPFFNA